jgi:hypothetical protein
LRVALILDQLRRSGYPVRDEDMARLHPYWYAHINVHGRYAFQAPNLPGGARREPRDPDAPDED